MTYKSNMRDSASPGQTDEEVCIKYIYLFNFKEVW
jgi:hypothetical protein